jgi:predicted regulator of Ras-like GTPase activity (Roadblock/LC7/MglB family)
MTSSAPSAPVSGEAAEQALGYLTEMSVDLRGGAILTASGEVLAASGEAERWGAAAKRLLAAADGAEGQPVEQIHVATEQGEVFAVRAEGLVAIAVTDRFTLASLMAYDLRAILRDLARGNPAGGGS